MAALINQFVSIVDRYYEALMSGGLHFTRGAPAAWVAERENELEQLTPELVRVGGELAATLANEHESLSAAVLRTLSRVRNDDFDEGRWERLKVRLQVLALKPKSPVSSDGVPTIWHHGERSYSRDGINSRVVTQQEHNLLQAFLKKSRAMDTRELEREVANVSEVAAKLGEKFGEAVKKPERKGEGYFIRVKLAKNL